MSRLSQGTPSRHGARPTRVLATTLLVLMFAWMGCGENSTAPENGVELSLGTPAASQAADISQVLATESLLDEMENPFSSVTGGPNGLGGFGGGNTDPGSWPNATGTVATTFECFRLAARLSDGLRAAKLSPTLTGSSKAAVAQCDTVPDLKCSTVSVCTEATSDSSVTLVSVTRTSCSGEFSSLEQKFYLHDNGTPTDRSDDLLVRFSSSLILGDGTEIDISITPQVGEFIANLSIVDVVETVRPGSGEVLSQTSTLTVNIGALAIDGDEMIMGLSSEVDFKDGSRASMTITDGDANGITDEDQLTLTWELTAPTDDPRLESMSAVITVLVHVLDVEEDDELVSMGHTLVFDGTTAQGGQPTSVATFTPAEPVGFGDEPCGGSYQETATFPADWEAQTFSRTITRACAGNGSSVLDMTFDDATSLHRTITWNGAGVVTLDASGRDGTTTSGQFDETDHTFALDVTFASGHDPVSVHQEGSSNEDLGTRSYLVSTTFLDAHTETASVSVARNPDGSRSLDGFFENLDGRVDFEFDWDRDERKLTGSTTGPQTQSSTMSLERQADGAALLIFTWQDPALDLAVSGRATINPDGSGCGSMTIRQGGTTVTTEFCFDDSGSGELGINGLPF